MMTCWRGQPVVIIGWLAGSKVRSEGAETCADEIELDTAEKQGKGNILDAAGERKKRRNGGKPVIIRKKGGSVRQRW